MEKKVKQSGVLRKRGRPAGKNRVPLSLDERRARNAQYERERREGMADALADLAASAGCHSSISSAELLATVITQLQQAMQVEDNEDLGTLRRCNENLMDQIEILEQRLGDSGDRCSARTRGKVVTTPRPVKRKRENAELPVDTPVPKRSPPEYTSPATYSECTHSPPAQFPVQQFPAGPSSSEYYSKEQYQSSEYAPVKGPERIYVEAKCALSHQSHHAVPWPPVATTSTQHFLPAPKISPASSTSDRPEVDYSSFAFARAPVPTPARQIGTTVWTSEYYFSKQQVCHRSPPQHYHYGVDLPIEHVAPYQAPETFHRPSSQRCPPGPSTSEDMQHFVGAIKLSPEFSYMEEHKSLITEPKYLSKQEFLPAYPWLPNAAMSAQEYLPVSRASDQEYNIDYSSYHFAGPQIPTPKYQIESTIETSEYILPVEPYTELYYQSPHQYRSSYSSPEQRFSPSQYLIPEFIHGSSIQHCNSGPSSPEEFTPTQYTPEMNYGASTSQQPSSLYQVPAQPNAVGSVEIIPIPGTSSLPDVDAVDGAEQDHRQGRVLSTEELISMCF